MTSIRLRTVGGRRVMPLFLLLAVLLIIIAFFLLQRVPRLPHTAGDWGAAGSDDPRVAVAAMMYSVATEDGPLTPEEERHILLLLRTKIGLENDVARNCLIGGKRMSRHLRGDLNSRLHQLMGPIERKCDPQEKQDVLDMLNAVAGRSAEHLGPVREGLGRLSSSLLQD
jgi:uncharacterized tellurite resistance protein B-like protein